MDNIKTLPTFLPAVYCFLWNVTLHKLNAFRMQFHAVIDEERVKCCCKQRRDIKQQVCVCVCDLLFSVSHSDHEQQALLLWDRGKPHVCVCLCFLPLNLACSLWWMLVCVWRERKRIDVFSFIFTHHLFRGSVNFRQTKVAQSLTPKMTRLLCK